MHYIPSTNHSTDAQNKQTQGIVGKMAQDEEMVWK